MSKTRIFILFSSGIIAGGIIVAVIMNYYYSDSGSRKRRLKADAETVGSDRPQEPDKPYSTDSTHIYIDKKLPIRILGDTNTDYYPHIDSNSKIYDSLKYIRDHEEVKINRDKLIAAKSIKLRQPGKKDSLSEKLNNVKEKERFIEVEFWQSPIQYKGYKLGRLRLVLFGINAEENNVLYDLKDYVILQSGNNYYRLDRTSEFKNLRKINDESVISGLNEN